MRLPSCSPSGELAKHAVSEGTKGCDKVHQLKVDDGRT